VDKHIEVFAQGWRNVDVFYFFVKIIAGECSAAKKEHTENG
jgi:hypothetical protein